MKGFAIWGGPTRVIVIHSARYSWLCSDDVLRILRERINVIVQAQHDVLRRVDTQ